MNNFMYLMNIQYCSCIASYICRFITSHLRLSCILSNSDVCLLAIKVLFYVLVSFQFGEISNVLSIVLKSLAYICNYIHIAICITELSCWTCI